MSPAFYLRYRPQRFADVVGQAVIVTALTRQLAANRPAHAYLFTGPRGTGKTTTARILAKGINCAKPKQGEPDNTCAICQGINDGSLLDVIEIDAASNRGIDEIRELRDKVSYAPSKAKRKVYIIDEVHMLTKEAFNALLKTLEEPPEHVTFILATTEPHKVPQTIISRCQRFDFKPATAPQIAGHLKDVATQEGLDLADEAAELVGRQARGSFRDALSMLDLLATVDKGTITAEAVRDVLGLAHVQAVAGLERALVARDQSKALEIIHQTGEQGISPELFRSAVIDYLRALLLAKVGAPNRVTGTVSKKAAELAADWSLPHLTAAIRAYVEAGDIAAAATVPELPVELATLELLESFDDKPVPKAETAQVEESLKTVSRSAPEPAPEAAREPEKAKPAAQAAPAPKDAQELWERLLIATKAQYSLSVCLQKTRPEQLGKDQFTLRVQSAFFKDKLEEAATRRTVEDHLRQLLGRDIKLKLNLAKLEEEDVFENALKVFEGAEVE